ncbi:hypothetical protein ABZW03_15610 [Kitasatospora sp. NPDC004799]|uniref:hypothetical protein n=1 Tax=Kitasatospora sp. NPDC004799 TaxID=3154460 RepID=UPI0033B5F0AA
MREQPSRTEPPESGPEFRPDGGSRPFAPLGAPPGSRPVTTPRTRHERAPWPPPAGRTGLGYGTGGGPAGARPHHDPGRTPVTPAPRAGVAIETTEDRA